MPDRPHMLNVDDRVTGCPDRQAGLSWPLPVDAKLEQLLDTARSSGEPTSRREIAAAIIAMTADLSADELGELLYRYRRATVGDVLRRPKASTVVEFKRYPPGPRKRAT